MTQATAITPASDPQSETDPHGIALDHVGISGVHHPILISGWNTDHNNTERIDATFTLKVSLAAENRGIHMSRLLETLHNWEQPLSPATIPAFLTRLRKQQSARTATLSCSFNWFIDRPAPETNRPAWQAIQTIWHGHQNGGTTTVGYTLRIPVTTLCPCSRAISDYGAHSQRGWIRVTLEWPSAAEIVAPREIFDQLQHAGSAPIYPLLKRADERHVTMHAYDNPAFVEDTARRAAILLKKDHRIPGFQIDVNNEESIHTHDAIATITYRRP